MTEARAPFDDYPPSLYSQLTQRDALLVKRGD